MNLQQWAELPEEWAGKISREESTKIQIITPLLKSLNWDIGSSPSSNHYVKPEYNVQNGSSRNRVDYAFIIDGVPRVYVEAKNINTDDLEKYESQLFNYMRNDGVPFGLLTNGKELKLFISDFDSRQPTEYLVGSSNVKHNYIEFLNLIEKNNLLNGKSDDVYEDIIRLKNEDKPEYTNLREKLKKYRMTYTPDVMLSTIFDDYLEPGSPIAQLASSKIQADPDTRCGFYTGTRESIQRLFLDQLVWGAVKKPKKDIEYIAMYCKEESAITHIGKIKDWMPVAEYENPGDLPSYEDDKIVFKISELYALKDPIIHSKRGSFGFQFKYTTIEKLQYADTISDI